MQVSLLYWAVGVGVGGVSPPVLLSGLELLDYLRMQLIMAVSNTKPEK